ncbi:MAG: 3-deoxy-D-manno-octulosonic acid transferase [Alphaproteobacteria bacterium]|nr:3-deoxy-D-manno-octulosonic acid transferase [Alphaproteobacteria bacterium]
MLSSLYRTLTDLGAPFIGLYMRRRRARGREDAARFAERFGYPSRPRSEGRLVWCHAASVGEATSLLLLIDKLHDVYPDLHILLTTGTVTAARLVAPRLPFYAMHQYVPIDRMPCVNRFLAHWRPCLALWIESELWPNTLEALRARLIPAVLLNARMSDKSFRGWHRARGWAREILSSFSLCLAQTEDDKGRLIALGASPVKCLGNLKYAALPLPCDDAELTRLRGQIANRPVWLMASTHRGEENMALAAHRAMIAAHPDVLTVIAPRHAARGDEIARYLASEKMRVARRSANDAITPDTQIYLADTMGELGLFYRLCPVTVLGGSFVWGGHNPIEPAQLETAIIFGPQMTNFAEIAREFVRADAAIQLHHANEIAFTVGRLLDAPAERDKRAQAAQLLAYRKRYVLDQIIVELQPWLSMPKKTT